jgi:general secretion pathway protein C
MVEISTYRRFFILVDLGLLVAAAFLVSRIVLSLAVPPVETPKSIPDGEAKQQAASDRESAVDTGIILERNLFGSRVTGAPPAAKVRTQEDIEDLPESPLPLELLGTVVQTRGDGSFAIILDKNTRQQQIYLVGDEVSGEATIDSVTRNRVVLLRKGREEILEKADVKASKQSASRSRPRSERVSKPVEAVRGDSSITVRKVGENSYVMDRREVEGVLEDFNQLLTKVRVVPHFSEGKPDGFKVFNIRPGSFFAQLGMVNGDIVKRVNGLDITGPEQALQMFSQLRDESQVTVDLERFRKKLTLQYEIR